jgi:predicted metal-dependent peptidase
LPGGLESFIDHINEPKLDWRSLLREFVQTAVDRIDYTWSRPNKPYSYYDVILPGLYGESTPIIVCYIDSSGSTNTKPQREAFAGEMAAIAEEVKPQRLYVVHNDAKVHKVQIFERGEEVHIHSFVGNGGTDFRPPFHWATKEGLDDEIACAVFLTDLEGPFPDTPPPYPVLWISTGAKAAQAPWGATLRLEVDR